MKRPELYRFTLKELEEAGLRAYMMRPDQLVFQTGHSNSGKSAWLSIYDDGWIIGTWAPRIYLIPPGADLVDLCRDFVSTRDSMAMVPDDLVAKFKLQKISDEQMAAILDGVHEPSYESIAANLAKRGFDLDQGFKNNLGVFGHVNGNKNEHYQRISVCEYEGSWHILTMGPFAYRIPIEECVEDVCAACLVSPKFDMFAIPQELVTKHSLVRLPHEEWEKIDNAIEVEDD